MSGLEAIGVAASIIQVADLGTKLSVQLFSFYRRYKNANESIQLLSNEIALVSAILRELGDNLEGEESSKLCSEEAFRTLRLVLTQCRDVLGQIQRVIDGNDQPGKSRFQQVTGKFRIVLLEPSLDQLKINLERLKSTMLLLLNVIMYAGQIRSNNVPVLVQEQRDLIRSLLDDKQADKPTARQLDEAADSPRDFSTNTIQPRGNVAHSGTDGASCQRLTQKDYLASKNQYLRASTGSTNSSGAHSLVHSATQSNEPPELNEYNTLIQRMLHEIESCRSKLEKARHSRIKDGVLNIHSGEMMRFKIEYGSSINIDHSLFTEQKSEVVLKPEVTDSSLAPRSSPLSPQSPKTPTVYIDSEESEFSESDISVHGRRSRIRYRPHRKRSYERSRMPVQQRSRDHRPHSPHDVSETDTSHDRQDRASVHRSPRANGRSRVLVQQASPHRSSGGIYRSPSADGQRIHERGASPVVVVSNERVRRTRNRTKPQPEPAFASDSDEEVESLSQRHHESGTPSRNASLYHRDEILMSQRVLEKSDSRQDIEVWKHMQEIERLERALEKYRPRARAGRDIRDREPWWLRGEGTADDHELSARLRRLERFERKGGPDEEREQMEYRRRLKRVEEAEKEAAAREEISRYKKGDITGTASMRNDEEHDSEDGLKFTVVCRDGDVAQEQMLSDLSLPDNLEDLLAQWTTLDKQEIQRVQIGAF